MSLNVIGKMEPNAVMLPPKQHTIDFVPTWNGQNIGLSYSSLEVAISSLSNPKFWEEWAEWMQEHLFQEDIDSTIKELSSYKPKVFIY